MNSFKEQIREDFAKVLLDPDVFGRVCSWNGAPLTIAEDANINTLQYRAQGVNGEIKVIYCRDTDLKAPPKAASTVELDGKKWQVYDVKKPFGHFIITLTRTVA
jgi:hypothetical protein